MKEYINYLYKMLKYKSLQYNMQKIIELAIFKQKSAILSGCRLQRKNDKTLLYQHFIVFYIS